MPSVVHLSDRAVLSVSGPDAQNFLQGLLTNDVRRYPGAVVYAALLTPQGKILFDFLLAPQPEGFLLDCLAESADALLRRLTMYRLRSKVAIAKRDDLAIIAQWGEPVRPDGAHPDPRLDKLGWRGIVDQSDNPAAQGGASAYQAHRMDCGVPEGSDFGHDRILALDAGLEELHGVSFEKGCYVGQELTARMKHRGTARKRLLPIHALSGAHFGPGDALVTAGHEIGTVMSSYGIRGFALVRLDRLADADQSGISVNGNAVRVTKPDWLSA